MPKRKATSNPNTRRKKRSKKLDGGKAVKKVKKSLNRKQRDCFIQLRKCIADHREFAGEAKAFGFKDTLKGIANNIGFVAKEAGRLALDIAQDPTVKGILTAAGKRILQSVAKSKFTPKLIEKGERKRKAEAIEAPGPTIEILE